ncbi:MAG: helix-turn-helix domain-containing protein [Dehalococcoidales bacterium]|jgi:excisionase family DNA binding protein
MAVEKMAYSIRETAEAIGLHPNTVYELVQEGKIPSIKLGRKILVSKIELAKFLAGQSNQQQPPAAKN